MNTTFRKLSICAALVAATAAAVAMYPSLRTAATQTVTGTQTSTARKAVEVVFVLDTTASMTGLIAAAKESAADAIMVSSLYGMARIDCADFGAKCQEAGIGHVRLYLGGILVTDPEEWPETEALFKGYGFHRVYPPQTKPQVAITDLKSDLGFAA